MTAHRNTEADRETADALTFSNLVWFSQSGSGEAIRPVTAAFIDHREAMAWAARHPGQTVHFPGGNQLQAHYAMADGADAFLEQCGKTRIICTFDPTSLREAG